MALARCPECDNAVSRSAPGCPHCGHPLTPATAESTPLDLATGTPSSSVALASMICGISGLVLLIVPCIWWLSIVPDVLGVVLACVAFGKISRGQASGRGMAITGLVCGILGIIITVPLLIFLQYMFSDAASD